MQKVEVNIDSQVNEIFAKTLVTQKIHNYMDNPIELEVFIDKYSDKNIFSSFEAQIGKSTKAKSKVIKMEKAEEKYTDSVSSGNAAIYTSIDPNDNNRIIVHIGNIPPKEELIFTSEFIQYTESSNNSYEYELFRNVPIIKGNDGKKFQNDIKGTLEIKTKSKIKNINKKFLYNKLIILEEKRGKDEKSLIMKYSYDINSIKNRQNNDLIKQLFTKNSKNTSMENSSYIPASKLLFE
jgi:hypothetical protein